jgi:hypothetical protein
VTYTRTALLAAVAFSLPIAAAGQGSAAQAARRIGAQLTDSAGVPVVVNPAQLPRTVQAWQISAEPTLEVGTRPQFPSDVLNAIRGGAVLSDGRMVLADDGNQQLRFYQPDGTHIRTVGGLGREPGTFQRLQLIGPYAGDSLLAFDYAQGRFSVFGGNGEFARSYPLPENLILGAGVIGVLSDGSAVIRRPWPLNTSAEPTFYRRRVMIDVLSADGASVLNLGEFPGQELSKVEVGLGGLVPAFSRTAYTFAAGDQIAVGTSDAFSVRLFDVAGDVTRIVRQNREPAPTDPQAKEALVEDWMKQARDDQRPELAAGLDQLTRHETLPAFGAVRLDRTGNLWVQEYVALGVEAIGDWQVFDPNGVLLARVRMPQHGPVGKSYFTILDIGEDYVLGRIQDERPLERVVLHRLTK